MPDDSTPAPLSKKVRSKKAEFLNRTFNGKAPRDSYPLCGRKKQRTGGSYKNLNKPLRSKQFRYPYRHTIPDEWLYLQRQPISEFAKDLLGEFLLYNAFWDAVSTRRLPVEFAGWTFLRVKNRQAEVVLKKLKEAQGPVRHFQLKAIEGFRTGKIARGAATAYCPFADHFYSLLAGGQERIAQIVTQGPREQSESRFEKVSEETAALEREVLEYTVCKFQPNSPVTKEAREKAKLLRVFSSCDHPSYPTAKRGKRS
jgi:hypothetical protein